VRACGDGRERNPYFRYINRNKKGITLDYKQAQGKALFLRLVETMDVLVENYRPTVMPRAGLGFEALREVNPQPISCCAELDDLRTHIGEDHRAERARHMLGQVEHLEPGERAVTITGCPLWISHFLILPPVMLPAPLQRRGLRLYRP
jgi:hypothetical protein